MHTRSRSLICALLVLSGAVLVGQPVLAQTGDSSNSSDLQALLEQVGKAYAEGYISPAANAFGANQNSALFNTAHIPGSGISISFGIKAMGTYLNEEDQTFRKVVEIDNLNDIFNLPDTDPNYDAVNGVPGYVVMEGPTIIGDVDTKGTVTGYANGLPVYRFEGIEGLVNTRWVPLAAPEVSVAGIIGLKATVRWLPEVDLGDYGKTKYMGWGLQFSPNRFLPMLPVDVAVGFFKQDIDVGDILDTDAQSVFVAASKSFGPATLYGGLAKEKATMKVAYTYTPDNPNEDPTDISFEIESVMKSRATVGVTLSLGLKLFAEAGIGQLNVYSGGILLGF